MSITKRDLLKIKIAVDDISKQYSQIPSDKLLPVSKQIMSYARAISNLVDDIELGARDSAIDVALRDVETMMNTMMDLVRRMKGKAVPVHATPNSDDKKFSSKGFVLPKVNTNPNEVPAQAESDVIIALVDKLPMTDEQKIGFLVGVALVYCRKQGVSLRPLLDQIEKDMKEEV